MTGVNRLTVTAVVPAFNEAPRLAALLEQLKQRVDQIVVVDDCSIDNTAKIAACCGADVIQHTENQGYINSIKSGFAVATGEIVITIDGDGEFSPEDIPALLEPIIEGAADMCQGRRAFVARPSERFLTWLASLKADVGDSGTGFRALRTDLARQLQLNGACICGILALEVASLGGRIVEVPVNLRSSHKPRKIAWFHIRQFFYLLLWLLRRDTKHRILYS